MTLSAPTRRAALLLLLPLSLLACSGAGDEEGTDDVDDDAGEGVGGGQADSGGQSNSSGGKASAGGSSSSLGGSPSGSGGEEPEGGAANSGGSGPAAGGDGEGGASTGGAEPGVGGDFGGGSSDPDGGAPSSGGSDPEGSGGGDSCNNDSPALACPDSWPTAQEDEEDYLLILVNEVRLTGTTCGSEQMPPVAELTMDETLRCAARAHSLDMMDRDFFSHGTWNPDACECERDQDCGEKMMCAAEISGEGPLHCGKAPQMRVEEVGGPEGAGWENIAAGNASAEDTMDQWMNSEGHCRNIMAPELVTIGVGYATGGGTYRHYWTQSFDN